MSEFPHPAVASVPPQREDN